MNIKARVTKILPENKCIAVDEQHNSYTAILAGNVKKNKLYVGDYIEILKKSDVYVVFKIFARKNYFIRPPVANIDYMILCVSLDMPKPDYLLLDKQIILCKKQNIEPIICVTKMDLINEENKVAFEYIKNVYENLGIEVFYTSSKNDDVCEKVILKPDKVYAFSGNSGVGKSSIISKLVCSLDIEVGEIAARTNRGKHTTKHVVLYRTKDGSYILDTPGFSGYELINIESKDLREFYPEFNKLKCLFDDCSHVKENERECAVKSEIGKSVDKDRYERYVYLYNNLKNEESYKYKR